MPLYKTIHISPYTKVYIWKIAENEDALSREVTLTSNSQARMNGMKSEIHRRGFLSIRHLLAISGYRDRDLFYDKAGKPHLYDGKNISITHSHHFTGIIIGDKDEVGIDIEMQRDKIMRIAHKFTPLKMDKRNADKASYIRKLTILWGAKESLYKIKGSCGLSFLKHIYIEDFTITTPTTKGEIMYEGNTSAYDITFLEFEGFSCVYAIKV